MDRYNVSRPDRGALIHSVTRQQLIDDAEDAVMECITNKRDPRYRHEYVTRLDRRNNPYRAWVRTRKLSDEDIDIVTSTRAWRGLPRGDAYPWDEGDLHE